MLVRAFEHQPREPLVLEADAQDLVDEGRQAKLPRFLAGLGQDARFELERDLLA